ncbi:hypothetical protein [Lactobacillus rhamnosus DSM 14870] [Lacticaseibacillus rhamnosus]|nr:hypothetical protein [Lactobacillus rhamnosus DSM 14870] [Lacticaseibacillus rhamnosus]
MGETPVQSTLALYLYAKHNSDLLGSLTYATVPETIWRIKNMTDVFLLCHRTAAHLARMGITSMYELAHANPCLLYTSDAADDTPCVDLGGRRIIKKKK